MTSGGKRRRARRERARMAAALTVPNLRERIAMLARHKDGGATPVALRDGALFVCFPFDDTKPYWLSRGARCR